MKRKPPKITGDTYVISDLHFGHGNVSDFEPSRKQVTVDGGFDTQEDMLIAKWNSVVTAEDTVVILGDYAFKGIQDYTRKLNGYKALVRGNHDKRNDHAYYAGGFDYVYNSIVDYTNDGNVWIMDSDDPYLSGATFEVCGLICSFTHYPLDYYEDYYTKQRRVDLNERVKTLTELIQTNICIHGHTHSTMVEDTNRYTYKNVSCDVLEFKPIKLKELLKDIEGYNKC